MAGVFISFEGGEGAGKSTQIARLAEALRAAGREVVTTREPGGSALAEALRGVLLAGTLRGSGPVAEAYLFAAARLDHVETVIRPALARGADVLCDRFVDSTRVYQGGEGGTPEETLAALEAYAVGTTMPRLTIVLDVPVGTGLARARARAGALDRFEGDADAVHAARRRRFRMLAETEPDRCVLIDGSGAPDVVAAEIARLVGQRLALPIGG